MMALGAGVVVPNVLRWYWWRLNGWGYSIGTFGGIFISLIALFYPHIPVYLLFPLICFASFILSILGSLTTEPTRRETLVEFYRNIRPFGFWRPIRAEAGLSESAYADKSESARITLLNVGLAMCAITGLYLSPMFLVGHSYSKAALWLTALIVSAVILKFSWYDNLPPAEES